MDSNKELLGLLVAGAAILIILIFAFPSLPSAVQSTSQQILDEMGKTADVQVYGKAEQPFVPVAGTLASVNQESVQLYDFGSAAAAEKFAASVSADGYTVTTETTASSISWAAPPHFFRSGQTVAIYVGTSSEVLDALRGAMGGQFAGTREACTLEARLCEDGSSVGRNPQRNCEFDPCPSASPTFTECEPEQRSEVCIELYDPVCGQTEDGERTFSNSCFACSSGAVGYTEGECGR